MIQETSRQSYAEVLKNIGEKQKFVLWGFSEFGISTDREMAKMLQVNVRSVAPRRLELVQLGYMSKVGSRRCAVSGKTAMIWKVNKN